ncbi:hypothetical protein DRQ36_08500 [bacterium]|nr:MAG: hypothetical protein DRQ36_08500 [bacterium]
MGSYSDDCRWNTPGVGTADRTKISRQPGCEEIVINDDDGRFAEFILARSVLSDYFNQRIEPTQ